MAVGVHTLVRRLAHGAFGAQHIAWARVLHLGRIIRALARVEDATREECSVATALQTPPGGNRQRHAARRRREVMSKVKAKATGTDVTPNREEEYIRGSTSAGGGGQGDPVADVTSTIGFHWLKKIQEAL